MLKRLWTSGSERETPGAWGRNEVSAVLWPPQGAARGVPRLRCFPVEEMELGFQETEVVTLHRIKRLSALREQTT